jgi:hypothetical protein
MLFPGRGSAADLTWDADTGSSGAQDGSGSWAGNNWWTGSANASWNSSTPDNAMLGNGGSGGTISLGNVTAGTVLFNNYSGLYTLSSGTLTVNSTMTIGKQQNNHAVKIDGATVICPSTIYIGTNNNAATSGNSLSVENGGQLLGGGDVVIGYKSGYGTNNGYSIGSLGTPSIASNGIVYVGYNSPDNTLTITNATLTVAKLYVGYQPGAVGGAGGNYGNTATVENQGMLEVMGKLIVGDANNYSGAMNYNSLLVKAGGVVTAGGPLVVGGEDGQSAHHNSAIIYGGGQLSSLGAEIGNQGTNNSITVMGGGSIASWDAGGGNISFNFTSNSVFVNGAGVAGSAIITNVNNLPITSGNRLSLASGGRLYAASATIQGILEIDTDTAIGSDCGRLELSGALNLSGTTLDIRGAGIGTFIVAEYGSLSGAFATILSVRERVNIYYNYGAANQVAVQVVAAGTVIALQ